ncbi:hypothetical protein IQ260_25670 [Leptolyngbya cf. ectocarpi LEGE 11479]|uniref:Tetratricopeptide repeat protein n=1 Tax=Leptolyngbya cf. ectocarpi LEGE 11479 TaxID=1828722 RepID=A0A928ZYV8_LEPEC|nr:hypothetical protein [Leptolyngbya ectocarpi]MBE9070034.1 hypothetical protein [Leptolyngbya cf. ectocarpi LEGE 11479]
MPDDVNRTELLRWKQYKQLAKEIYNALIAKNIKYALEPEHNDANIQLIRTPEEILETRKEGTCLDLAVLYCGLCLGFGLLPLLIVLRKHALAAVSLHYSYQEYWEADAEREYERSLFQKEPLKNFESLRNLLLSRRFIFIECTGFSHTETALSESKPEGMQRQEDGTLTFERAMFAGAEQLEQFDRPFEFALDAAIAHRYWKIKPDNFYPHPRASQSKRLNDLKQLIASGYQLLSERQFDEAEAQFDLARKLHRGKSEPWLGKAHISFAQGRSGIAIHFVNKALQQNSTHWQTLAFKIKLLLLLGGNHWEEAKKLTIDSQGLSKKLDNWLNCLAKEGIFTQILITEATLDSLCPFPRE